jgi:hemolysin activation/secretion protein
MEKRMLRYVLLFVVTLGCAVAAEPTQASLFKRLVLADSESTALSTSVDPSNDAAVIVRGLPLLEQKDFSSVIEPLIGKAISTDLLNTIGNAIAAYARAHDRLITKVIVPNQVVSDGTVRLVVVFGRFSDIEIKGNRWFSSDLLEQRLGIKPGDEVRLSLLEEAVNWANTNPFRRVKVFVDPLNNQPGKANLLVGVQEVWPWRFSVSVDNYGNDVLGKRHYIAGVQAGNLWGRDHQASYQFVTTDDINVYQAHVFGYRVPLPWRHFIEVSGSLVRVNAVFGNQREFTQTGRNESASLRYTIPIRNGDNPVEVHAGFDAKLGNNNLEYGGIERYPRTAETYEINTGGSAVFHDKHGATVVAASVLASPGGLGSRNNTETYEIARFGSTPRYVYASLSLQRLLDLTHNWELTTRFTGQKASANLLGSEQMTAGGAASVRGFNTNIYAGDEGFVLNNDLLAPSISTPLQRLSKKLPPLETRFVAFYDVAQLWLKHRYAFDVPMRPLASAGLGLRMSVSNNFSLTFDYGWQITHLPELYRNTQHGQGHIKVVLAF